MDIDAGKYIEQIASSDENAITEMGNQMYPLVTNWMEGFEHADKIRGNGHHMAQMVVEYAQNLVRERLR